MIPVWKLDAALVLGLACLGVLLGFWLKRKIPLLDRLNIPVPIVGGMVYAVAALALRDRVANFEADVVLRDLLMVAFMTTIGLNARLQLIREGGMGVIRLLAIASFGAVLQNLLGMGLALALGVDARLGILTGSVALAGGPATALAFGGTFERMGVAGATTVAFAAATFGITVAGLIGGYIGGWLIRRHNLKPGGVDLPVCPARAEGSAPQLLTTVLLMGIAIGLGSVLSAQLERLGLILPGYIGAMIVAALIRNLADRFGFVRISQGEVLAVGRIVLYLFIVMALVTLRLWELTHLALPMIAILAAQVALCWLMCVAMSFRAMGRDYESAVTAAGFCGFMLGITSNAIASMEELVEKYGPAPRSFLVVPVVGAFLIDFTNSLIITAMANLTR
ncbi:MAG: sodium/glutamate symporter [Acidobacteriia bacterium]|nr:sodium/glutamate symporter [Terriglobia bacterium]